MGRAWFPLLIGVSGPVNVGVVVLILHSPLVAMGKLLWPVICKVSHHKRILLNRVKSEAQCVGSTTSGGINATIKGVTKVRKLWEPCTTLITQFGPQNGQNIQIAYFCLIICL